MLLASLGFWGGNPEVILKAPIGLVANALNFVAKRENMKRDILDSIIKSLSNQLGG